FRAGAVRIVTETGKSAAEVARDLGVHESTLQNWVHRARARADADADGGLSESERDELRRLREENIRQRKEIAELGMERDVLKRSVVLWVKEAMK
ncbi:transposase, partial [Kitasatospora sp. NPDC017646]